MLARDDQANQSAPVGCLYLLAFLLPLCIMMLAFGLDEKFSHEMQMRGNMVYHRNLCSTILIFGGSPVAVGVLLKKGAEKYKIAALLYLVGSITGVALTVTVG